MNLNLILLVLYPIYTYIIVITILYIRKISRDKKGIEERYTEFTKREEEFLSKLEEVKKENTIFCRSYSRHNHHRRCHYPYHIGKAKKWKSRDKCLGSPTNKTWREAKNKCQRARTANRKSESPLWKRRQRECP